MAITLNGTAGISLPAALPLTEGGTGGTTAAAARTSLGAQAILVSGTNIKTVGGTSIVGSGDVSTSREDQINWKRASVVQRSNPLVAYVQQTKGLTDAAIDALFTRAATL